MRALAKWCAPLLIMSCGSKSSSSDPAPSPVAPSWTEVKAALDSKCIGCHNNANIESCKINFTGSEAEFKLAQACLQSGDTPAARVALTSGKVMPKSGSPALTDAEKSAIINFK